MCSDSWSQFELQFCCFVPGDWSGASKNYRPAAVSRTVLFKLFRVLCRATGVWQVCKSSKHGIIAKLLLTHALPTVS